MSDSPVSGSGFDSGLGLDITVGARLSQSSNRGSVLLHPTRAPRLDLLSPINRNPRFINQASRYTYKSLKLAVEHDSKLGCVLYLVLKLKI